LNPLNLLLKTLRNWASKPIKGSSATILLFINNARASRPTRCFAHPIFFRVLFFFALKLHNLQSSERFSLMIAYFVFAFLKPNANIFFNCSLLGNREYC